MRFSRYFLGLLAVGFTVADHYDSSDSKHVIKLHEIYYPRSALVQGVLDGYYLDTTIYKGTVADIASTHGGLTSNPNPRWETDLFERANLFETYFRAPLTKSDSEDYTEIYLVFSYSAGTRFEFYENEEANIPYFKHWEKFKENSTHIADVYRVKCLPGTVFPIRLVVFGAGKDKAFKLEWTLSPKYDSRQSLGASTVDMMVPHWDVIKRAKKKGLSPIKGLPAVAYDTLPLHGPLPASSLRNLVVRSKNDKEFMLAGYIQLDPQLTMLVLSSTTSVTADIFALKSDHNSRGDPAFYHSTMWAGDDAASQIVLKAGGGSLYEVIIRGKYDKNNEADISLMAYNPEFRFEPKVVNLLVPKVRPWEQQQSDDNCPLNWPNRSNVIDNEWSSNWPSCCSIFDGLFYLVTGMIALST